MERVDELLAVDGGRARAGKRVAPDLLEVRATHLDLERVDQLGRYLAHRSVLRDHLVEAAVGVHIDQPIAGAGGALAADDLDRHQRDRLGSRGRGSACEVARHRTG
jgi:hypothetical protein